MKILFIIAARGFQPLEYGQPKKILLDAGVEVVTASDKKGAAVSSITDEKVEVDLSLDEIKVSDYDGVFIIGGPGALEHLDNESAYRVIRQAAASGKLFGAICVSPRILARAGVLKNKKATGWDDDRELAGILSEAGAEYVRQPVVVDGQLITAWGPDAAAEFGKTILKLL